MAQLSARVLACSRQVPMRLMVRGRRMMTGLSLRRGHTGLGRRSLIEVVGINLLLAVGLHQRRGKSAHCEYESEHSERLHKYLV